MLAIILQINILGKSPLTPSNVIDQLQNYVLGAIIGGIIYNQDITILQFFMVLIVWTIIVFAIHLLTNHSRLVRRVINGKPMLLIRNGQLLTDQCLRTGISANEIMFRLREKGIYEVAKVKSALLEQNGQLVVIENDEENIKFPLIADGIINKDVLELIRHDEDWLLDELHRQGISAINDVFLGEYIHGQLKLTLYPVDK